MQAGAAAASALLALVNPFVGTASKDPNITHGGGAGATLPGAVVPFGLVQLSPETTPARAAFGAGYERGDTRLRGFSPTHVSGTGCAVFGDVPILPIAAPATGPATAALSHARETASPGSYGVTLGDGTRVALTATARTGVLRATFPRGDFATLLVDAGGSQMGDDRAAIALHGRTADVTATSGRFCGASNSYTLHVALRFSVAPRAWGTWSGANTARRGATRASDARRATGARPVPGGFPVAPVRGARAGAYLRFAPGSTVEVRIGVSFVDAAGARRNLAAEAPPRRSFAALRAAARAAWARQLARLPAPAGLSATRRRVFTTALYHALLHPNVVADADGRWRGPDGRVRTARGWRPRSTIAGWDIYRTQFPLLARWFPEQARDVARTLLTGAGCPPRFALAGADAGVMTGSPAAILLAETPGLSARTLLARAVRAIEPPCRDARPQAAVENAVADAAVARLADRAGDAATAQRLRDRSAAAWAGLDLATAPLVEGSPAQYAFTLPPYPAGALDRLRATLARLDGGPFDAVAGLGNEPSLALPWLPAVLGDVPLARDAVRRGAALYTNSPDGLPGNDDAGTLSSWLIFATLGRYPLTPGDPALTILR